MIDPSKLKIISNYVLVLPDKDFETYQFGGKETGILAASYEYDEKGQMQSAKQKHIAVSGIVYAVPNKLIFNADKIWNLQDNNDLRQGVRVRQPHIQQKIDRYRSNSVQFDVPIEISVGDRVYFEYLAHQLSQSIMTDLGIMLLIKYDMLIMTDKGTMLNGFILVENEEFEAPKSTLTLVMDKTEKKTRNRAQGKVISSNGMCNGYLDHRNHYDGNIETGDTIVYDPRFAKELEYGLHRIFSEKRLIRIQRKDVYAVLDKTALDISYI